MYKKQHSIVMFPTAVIVRKRMFICIYGCICFYSYRELHLCDSVYFRLEMATLPVDRMWSLPLLSRLLALSSLLHRECRSYTLI